MSVELNILEYDLEGAADCHYDYLEVYSGFGDWASVAQPCFGALYSYIML